MTIRNLLLATAALGLALVGAAPAASALGEDCTVSAYSFRASVTCTGTFPESAHLTWCPNEPWIDCNNFHVLTCEVGTTNVLLCPLASATAAPDQSCTVMASFWDLEYACGGTVTGSADIRWCPFDENPNIQCVDDPLLWCTISTNSPWYCMR